MMKPFWTKDLSTTNYTVKWQVTEVLLSEAERRSFHFDLPFLMRQASNAELLAISSRWAETPVQSEKKFGLEDSLVLVLSLLQLLRMWCSDREGHMKGQITGIK